MIVDDHDHMCVIVREVLYAFGARKITSASSVDAALDKYPKAQPDVMIIDFRMKPINGIQFAKFLRSDPDSPNKYIPIIMMTADATKQVVRQAMAAGINELLVKPLRPIDIWKRIEAVVMNPQPFIRTAEYFGPDRRKFDVPIEGDEERRTEEVELL